MSTGSSDIAKIHPQGARAFSLTPQSLDEAMRYAEVIAKSDIVPQDYKGKPGNVLVAVQMGLELGLPPLQALQNIAIINGRPTVWGDSLIAIARAHPGCEYITETFNEQSMTATCKAKRRGEPEQVRTFSQADAELAKLWVKATWQQYPKRMLQMRARGFAVRDVFPDALRGLALAEEVRDYPIERDMGPAPVIERTAERETPCYPSDQFEANLPKWLGMIDSGKQTAENVIAKVQTKGALSEAQQARIRGEHVEGELA